MVDNELFGLEEMDRVDFEVQERLNRLVAEWDKGELVELIAQCEFALSINAGEIGKLEAKGFKKFWQVITGVRGKSKREICKNVQEIQKASLEIQKALLQREELVMELVISLNQKVNQEIIWSQDNIYRIRKKIDSLEKRQRNTDIKAELALWNTSLKNKITEDGKKYMEVSDSRKILLVVSDIFGITKGRERAADKPFLESALQELGVSGRIGCRGFYEGVSREKECITLYRKDKFDYGKEGVSKYGRMIDKIHKCYEDPIIGEISGGMGLSIAELCINAINKDLEDMPEEVDALELCQSLLKDLAHLKAASIKAPQRPFKKLTEEGGALEHFEGFPERDAPISPPKAPEKIAPGKVRLPNGPAELSVLKLMPEGIRTFRSQAADFVPLEIKNKYMFSDEAAIKRRLYDASSYLSVIPVGYFKGNGEERGIDIKNVLESKGRICISLSDYYAYLWFCSLTEGARKGKAVAMIEYYNHKIYVSGYIVNQEGDGYQKAFKDLAIFYGRTGANIIKDIQSQEAFRGKGNIQFFRTFQPETRINKKLDANGVQIVDDAWEGILRTGQERLEEAILDMAGKSELIWA